MAMDSHIAFSLNKTSKWLLNQENYAEIIKNKKKTCRKEVGNERKRFWQHEELNKTKRIEKQNEDFMRTEELEKKELTTLKKREMIRCILGCGTQGNKQRTD